MKILAVILIAGTLMLGSCGQNKPADQKPEILLHTSQECDHTLNLFEDNIRQLQMLSNDVVDNVDAIIAIQEENSEIIKAIDENPKALSQDQLQRYHTLREEYQKHTGN